MARTPSLATAYDVARCLPAIAVLMLASCSGGGGGGGGSSNGLSNNPVAAFLPAATEPATPFAATDWSTSQEYLNSTGLAQLNAAEGYARRSAGLPGGQGVRIAIIDAGIDVSHPDLGNLAAQSWSAGGEELVAKSHGTFVAGIAGASRTQSGDSNDMHGLAYRATLVNFQAARPSSGSVTFITSDLVAAVTVASGLASASASVESDVINLSLGAFSSSDGTFSSLRTAMRNAAAADKIMVIAAGNEGLDSDPSRKLQPIYPAAYADDAGIAGHAIAVGNLTAANQAAPSSNLCGDTRNFCLFAPGTNIRSTLNGGGYGIGSGTSFAAPYVSGAAAVVKAGFPGVSGADVVNRLLLTATDLGAAGVDDVFGRGLLDLEAAMNPIGPVGLITGPTVDSDLSPLTDAALDLGAGFALDHAGQSLLERAVGFDQMGFPFPVDLTRRVRSTSAASGLERFIQADRTAAAAASLAHTHLSVALSDDPARIGGYFSALDGRTSLSERERGEEPAPHLAFSTEPARNLTLFASVNGSAGTRLGLQNALSDRRFNMLRSETTLTPFDRLGGPVSGGGLALEPYDGGEIAISAFSSLADHQESRTSLQKLEFTQSLPGLLELRLGLGLLQEEGGFFGASANGAFAETMDSRSQFADLSLTASLADGIHWFAAYSRGRSSIDSQGGLLSDWSSAQADAFATGLSIQDLAKDNDSLTLMVGQPFRAHHAKATLSVPVGRTPDGSVVTEQQRIDLEPAAREITSEATYRWSLDPADTHQIQAGAFARFNPDHNQNTPPDLGLALHYRHPF